MESRRIPGDGLLRPLALAAIALLALNDHVFKSAFAGAWWTGKLSDLAGLAFFPLFLQALVELAAAAAGRPLPHARRTLAACAALTALVFALVKTTALGADAYRIAWGALQAPFRGSFAPVAFTMDPADLVALPAVALALWAGWIRDGFRRPRTA